MVFFILNKKNLEVFIQDVFCINDTVKTVFAQQSMRGCKFRIDAKQQALHDPVRDAL
jgi:hypothetical protein